MGKFNVWAIADLHLAFGDPEKSMDAFGEPWIGYTEKIQKNWLECVQKEDLVLIPGDISWAMHPEVARLDLEWIDRLPGTKVILRGNHDYWWTSLSKIEKIMPPSLHIIQNNAFDWQGVSIAGTRLWDSEEYNFHQYIDYHENPRAKKLVEQDLGEGQTEKIFQRELGRLEMSLKCLSKDAELRIAMTHYPPIGADMGGSQVSELLEKYRVNICVFGHLHNVKGGSLRFGVRNGIHYHLVSCDYLHFRPLIVRS